MKKLLGLFAIVVLVAGCTSSSPTVSPIVDAGCTIETAITAGMGASVATALNCSNASAIQASIQMALGNVNLCASSTTAQSTAAAQVKLNTKLTNKAIVGDILCPIALNTIVGYLSNTIPSAWSCSQSATVTALQQALTAACESAVPI